MENYIFIILFFIMMIWLTYALISKLPYFKRKKTGAEGERKTNEILQKFVKNKKCLLMTNTFLPLYNGTCEIDHMLFGNFGVLVVETKNISGELSGNGEQLNHKIGNKTFEMYNPVLQNETHVKNVKYHLMKSGFKDVPVYSIVVFTSNNIKFPMSIGIHISELEKNIKNLPDNKCSPEKLYKAINKIKVTAISEKLKHNIRISMKK